MRATSRWLQASIVLEALRSGETHLGLHIGGSELALGVLQVKHIHIAHRICIFLRVHYRCSGTLNSSPGVDLAALSWHAAVCLLLIPEPLSHIPQPP